MKIEQTQDFYAPRRLISLWDMIQFFLEDAIIAQDKINLTYNWSREQQRDDPALKLPDEMKLDRRFHLETAQRFCQKYGLKETDSGIEHLFWLMRRSGFNISEMAATMDGIFQAFIRELVGIKCLFVEPTKIQYFEQEMLFGNEVSQSFPSAAPEIKAAGNCLSIGLDTACIFHLMRVIELGLRALAKKLKVKFKNSPVEYLTWEKIIPAIDSEIAKLNQTSKGKKKSETLAFYHGLVGEFNAFKDVWRNNTMHTRCTYDEHQALSAFNHVKGFMQRLATKVKE